MYLIEAVKFTANLANLVYKSGLDLKTYLNIHNNSNNIDTNYLLHDDKL